jgi:two-component system response regulator DevR
MKAPAVVPIRVLIVDDSPLIRIGLRRVLEDRAGIAIVGEAGTAAEGVAEARKLKPEVVLLDLRLPDKPGLTACREMLRHRPDTHVLILTSSTDERQVQEAIAAGARGYLLKENDGDSLEVAIQRAAAGHSVIDPSLADQMLRLVKRPHEPGAAERLAALSPQERRVVALLADGLMNKEIGEHLGLTEKTVKNYLGSIFTKLNISRRTQAVALYVEASRQAPP